MIELLNRSDAPFTHTKHSLVSEMEKNGYLIPGSNQTASQVWYQAKNRKVWNITKKSIHYEETEQIESTRVRNADLRELNGKRTSTTSTQVHRGVCGKCGQPRTGQTFQGPAGLGLICAECQAELDRDHRLGDMNDERLFNLLQSAIYKLGYVRSIHEFNAVEVLMEFPKGTGATIETVESFMTDSAADLKIERVGDKWTKVDA